jgi:hypothetical protein
MEQVKSRSIHPISRNEYINLDKSRIQTRKQKPRSRLNTPNTLRVIDDIQNVVCINHASRLIDLI